MSDEEKRKALSELAGVIDSKTDWWRFPSEKSIQGFMGTGPICIVGDQPSRSEWPASHPNRRVFYDHLQLVGISNAHLTDLYKKRGKCSALRDGLPDDFGEHMQFFRKEIEIIRPTRIVALGHLAYQLLMQHLPELRSSFKRIWHFSWVVRAGMVSNYASNIRRALP